MSNYSLVTTDNHQLINTEYQRIQSDWNEMVSNIGNIDSFLSLIEKIKTLSKDKKYEPWVKWKDINNQIVLKSENFYYKIYQCDYRVGTFACEIRNKLAKLYQQKFGILWNIATIEQGNVIYQIEQREKLEVCDLYKVPFEEILLDWSYTLEELENSLKFPYILQQLQKSIQFKEVNQIKLLRECINNHVDYAFTPDKKHFVLLDDTDFFIAMLDKNYQWMQLQRCALDVETTQGILSFTPIQQDRLEQCISQSNKWFLLNYNINPSQQNLMFRSLNEEMLNTNLYILSHKQLPDNFKLYCQQRFDQWGNFLPIVF